MVDLDNVSTASGEASISSSGNNNNNNNQTPKPTKKKRNLPGMPGTNLSKFIFFLLFFN
jgi:hypothetical protein